MAQGAQKDTVKLIEIPLAGISSRERDFSAFLLVDLKDGLEEENRSFVFVKRRSDDGEN